jgi:hypothetical protein
MRGFAGITISQHFFLPEPNGAPREDAMLPLYGVRID